MSTQFERLKNATILAGGRADYAARIVKALGDPSKWEYRGECHDNEKCTGRCVCGQEGIRFEFTIYYNGQSAILGSSCICHYFLLNPEQAEKMAEDYEKLLKLSQAAKSKAKRAAQMLEVVSLGKMYEELRTALKCIYDEDYKNWRRSIYSVYSICAPRCRYSLPTDPISYVEQKYTRPCDMKRWIEAAIARMQAALTENKIAHGIL